MAEAALLACDWGTTNLRAWSLDAEGKPLQSREFELGVSRLKPGEAERAFHETVCPALGAQGLPAMLCGMIGSNLGWTAVDYAPCPAGLAELGAGMAEVEGGAAPVRIVPGVRGEGLAGGADVMRGEETQALGWLEQDAARRQGRHLVCHPGTHAKWILIEDGRIVRFVTFMTGELFAVLGRHSVLKSDAPADDEAAFDEGLKTAGDGGALAARLFSARSRVTALGQPPESTPSYLSGLLIGAEAAAAPALVGLEGAETVELIGEPALCRWYQRALAARGLKVKANDGVEAALAGLWALHRMGQGR